MRAVLRRVLASALVRWSTLALISVHRACDRLSSYCRARALFPDTPDLVCHRSVEVKYPRNLSFGRKVVIGPGSVLGAASPVSLGDHVHLSRDVIIETAGLDFGLRNPPYHHVHRPIRIGTGVWIGARAVILGGVTIGDHAVIASGSVVTRNVPAGAVAGGVPARVLRMIGNPSGLTADAL